MISEETLQELVTRLSDAMKPQKIVLFGSASRGNWEQARDLDLLVIQETELPMHERIMEALRAIEPLPCPVDVLVYTPEEWERWRTIPGTIHRIADRTGRIIYG